MTLKLALRSHLSRRTPSPQGCRRRTDTLGIWDAVILSAASRSGCRLLLSEDLQKGFTWAGVAVVNPFASTQHALLQALLEEDDE